MIREIMRDETFLAQKAEPATRSDLPVAQDLLDTLEANKERCVGMAANMIGINKGCLSLEGTRPAKRWQSIKVRYQNEKFQERFRTFTGWTAQIIQHEIDHCEGIII